MSGAGSPITRQVKTAVPPNVTSTSVGDSRISGFSGGKREESSFNKKSFQFRQKVGFY